MNLVSWKIDLSVYKIIFDHQDKLVQDKLLLDPNIKLNKAIYIGFDAEARRLHKQIDSSSAVNAVVLMKSKLIPKLKKSTYSADLVINNCKYCGKQHKVQQCPAFGKMCRNCGKRNHFANVCSSKRMHQIEAEAKDDDDNNNEQFFNVGSLVNCNSLKSKINAYLTVKDYASVKYKILLDLDTVLKYYF